MMDFGVMGDDDWRFLKEEMGNSIPDEDRAIRSKDQLADIGEMIVASFKDKEGRCDFEKCGRRLAGLIEYDVRGVAANTSGDQRMWVSLACAKVLGPSQGI